VRGRTTPGSSRRRAREAALQVLYAIDLAWRPSSPDFSQDDGKASSILSGSDAGPGAADASFSLDETFNEVVTHFEVPEGSRTFARELVSEVCHRRPELDRSISASSSNWRVDRMAAVDRNILRLGTYELAHTETPAPVILNEAVDLARRFSNDPSPAFVNGILDAVARVVRDSGT
jgi:transcription antitermination factor NusB